MSVVKSDSSTGVIYKITTPNGSIYIGQTVFLKARIRYYKNLQSKGQKLLHRALIKYGFDNCQFDILEACNASLLCEREIYWIDLLKANRSKYPEGNGLNLTDGGEGTRGYKHDPETSLLRAKKRLLNYKPFIGPRSQEWKDNISKAHTGKKCSPEHCKNIGLSKKGIISPKRGIPLADEQKLKISIANTGKKAWNARMLFDTGTGIFYESSIEASAAKNTNHVAIWRDINNKSKKFGLICC